MIKYEKVIGVRDFDYTGKKSGKDSHACVVSLASKNSLEGSWGCSCREVFIDIKSNAYSTAMNLKDGDLVVPLEQNGFVQEFMIQEKKEK